MCIKKRLGKYRNSEQQFNTCSPLSCIYWTVDAIISSAVFFHNACVLTGPDSTLEYGKSVRAIWLTLAFMKRRGKKSLPGQISGTICGGEEGSWKPESRLKSLYPLLQTLFTQLWLNRAKSDQKTWTNSWSPTRGICEPWGHNVHVHTQTHTCVTETRAPCRQGGKAGPSCRDVRENKSNWVKVAAGHEIWDDWFSRGNEFMQCLWAGCCSLTQPLLTVICQVILHSWSWCCFPWTP